MEHESKRAASNMNFNVDDMGISWGTCLCNILRGYEQNMGEVRWETSVPIGFLYFGALDPAKMISFLTYCHVPSAALISIWPVVTFDGSGQSNHYKHCCLLRRDAT
jgi:hypothetical protein